MRTFETGATRSPLGDKLQYEGYLNPLVLQRFARYMKKHQTDAAGNQREADNWQKGIPLDSLMDSSYRHYMDWWMHHRGYGSAATENVQEALCAVIFNAMAYLKAELEKAKPSTPRSDTAAKPGFCECGKETTSTWLGKYMCKPCQEEYLATFYQCSCGMRLPPERARCPRCGKAVAGSKADWLVARLYTPADPKVDYSVPPKPYCVQCGEPHGLGDCPGCSE